jgi:endoglucanase
MRRSFATSTGPEITRRALLAAPALLPAAALGAPRPEVTAALARGLNITNWFRFPRNGSAAPQPAYVPPATLSRLRQGGVTCLRITVTPEVMRADAGRPHPEMLQVLHQAIAQVLDAGMAVLVAPYLRNRPIGRDANERAAFLTFTLHLAGTLKRFPPNRAVAEVLNEPAIPDAEAWAALQSEAVEKLRDALPRHAILASGTDWGSVGGLLKLERLPDANLLYSFHFYEPVLFTGQGMEFMGEPMRAISALRYPTGDAASCRAEAQGAHDRARDVLRWFCTEGYDGAKLAARIEAAAAWGERAGAPLFCGEFGVSPAAPRASRLAWFRDLRAALDAQRIGWALWGWDDAFGLRTATAADGAPVIDQAVASALGLRAL